MTNVVVFTARDALRIRVVGVVSRRVLVFVAFVVISTIDYLCTGFDGGGCLRTSVVTIYCF